VPAWARQHIAFRRGFVDEVGAGLRALLKGAAGLSRRAPLTSLRLSRVFGDAGRLAAWAQPATIRDLRLHDVRSDCARELLGSEHLGRLGGLYLESYAAYGTGSCHLGELLAPAHWPALSRLGLSNLAFRPADLARLCEHLARRPLTALRLTNTDLSPGGVAGLVGAAPGLRRLDLSGTWHLSDDAVGELVNCAGLAGLSHLDLSGPNRLTDAAARALAGSPHLAKLTDLGLNSTGLTDAGLAALVGSPNLPRLSLVGIFGARVDGGRWKVWQARRAPGRWWVSWVWLRRLR
jgi:hypothetical protein